MDPSRGRRDEQDRTQRMDLVSGGRSVRGGLPPVPGRPAVPPRTPHREAETDQQPDLRWDETATGVRYQDDRYDDDRYDDRYDDDWHEDDDAPAGRRPRDPLWQVAVRGFGQLLVTAGLVVMLFVFYEVYVTDFLNDRTQGQLSDQIHEQWDAAPATDPAAEQVAPPVGAPVAVVHIPRLGEDYEKVVLEGTTEDELSQGPGRYVDSALPGQQGNFALAGHRVGKGSPFLDADKLLPGDPIVVETASSWYVYRVLGTPGTTDYGVDANGVPGQQIVTPDQVAVINPVPGGTADAAPAGAYLTLTTCHPKYSARQRLIVHAVLDGGPISKTEAPDGPPALQEG
ncbi:class E sortase [Modestobacter sp. VKM Ac-2986]|uniref:class E sortase n=1 Tax=Modestobacter sp. VKM Ac-2986 TaxID=3004140 RepID=UPI0022AB731B|nr:class E sortase [Modestobacter sp. VKM Ac-2986]MCZ2830916.1 class E sortase [Modestobacter sp. VKM Ac-2986]